MPGEFFRRERPTDQHHPSLSYLVVPAQNLNETSFVPVRPPGASERIRFERMRHATIPDCGG
jgi:hypothetical protein